MLAVGPAAEVEARFGPGERLDAVLLPALVNAHTHLELSHLHGRVPGGDGLPSWIQLLVAARAAEPESDIAVEDGVAALTRFGVAAVGDVSNGLGSIPWLSRAGVAGTVYQEVFGFTGPRIERALAQARLLAERAPPLGPGLRRVLTPHAVYSTHLPRLVELLAAGPASLHLAEDPAERRFCSEATGPFAGLHRSLGVTDLPRLGRSPVEVVARHLRPGTLVVHVVDLDDEDRALLARSGATAVLCPRSNLHIGGRLADLPKLLEAGVPLAVGTDSLASAPSLSPLAELATLSRAWPEVSPLALLQLAWNGAAVGAPAVGRLEPGRAPGVLAAPIEREELGDAPFDPCRWLLDVFGREELPFTWLARHRPEPSA
ncbi:amidohydrolase family protein [Anaeromyxobacter paludicola]|uniref:amidohydrolase family protein n=1 Tax=Anaeromyxobacter paludicola TaxID=2918171 RepID=UPI0020BE1A2A|nr:amidohydrolase family protein [Anaeromyxobacter paludicola]